MSDGDWGDSSAGSGGLISAGQDRNTELSTTVICHPPAQLSERVVITLRDLNLFLAIFFLL